MNRWFDAQVIDCIYKIFIEWLRRNGIKLKLTWNSYVCIVCIKYFSAIINDIYYYSWWVYNKNTTVYPQESKRIFYKIFDFCSIYIIWFVGVYPFTTIILQNNRT